MKNIFLKIINRILAFGARRVINRFDPYIIAVTGSVGKSSTKEAIHHVLSEAFGASMVWSNAGNLNTEIGVPLTILGYKKVPGKTVWPLFVVKFLIKAMLIRSYPKYLVLELGVDKPGDMRHLMTIFRPKIAVLTAITKAHLANFTSYEEYASEKLLLLDSLAGDGRSVINSDDARLVKFADGDVIRVGIESKSVDYRAEGIKLSLDGTEYRVTMTGRKIAVKSSLLGRQMIYSQLFALAVADLLDLSLLKTAKSLEGIKPVSGRMRLIEGKNDISIIDDTYNASPASVSAALDFLSDVQTNSRKVAIIGNMNELGDHSEEAHKEVAEYAKDRCDLAVFVGPYAKDMAKVFNDDGRSLVFASRSALVPCLDGIIKDGDLVLIKASQNRNFFEEVVKLLMKNPNQAKEFLVRQGGEWNRKKR
ncbi:MAG: UDP-N-acetylmuramoyl-tripeptide--D-alanyl-D-alanine ligase [Patescibacteria group bacterium]|jgi:UDP-N-acetylmuramoyl-tripeptide--D-alanyl-D-alanine ligase